MNSKNSKTSDPYAVLQVKQTSEEKIKILLYQILAFTIHGKI